MNKSKNAYVFVAVAGILWGIISIFVKQLTTAGLSSLEIVEVRALFSAVILIILCLVKNPRLLKIHVKDLWLFLGTGIVSIALFNYCYFRVINISGVSTAALLLYTAPAFVMVISIPVLKEKMSLQKTIALLLTVSGLICVTGILTANERISLEGILLGLGSGFGYAMYSILGKFLIKKYDTLTITTYTFLITALGMAPFLSFSHIAECIGNIQGFGAAAGIAMICTVIPFLTYTVGLRHIDAGKASIVATIEPLVAAILGIVVYHENATTSKILGIILILVAIVVLNIKWSSRTD